MLGVLREERDSVATVCEEMEEFWESWVGDSGLCCHLVYGALAGSVGLGVPGKAGLGWAGHGGGLHRGVHIGGDCPQHGGGAGAGGLGGPELDVGGGDDDQEAWVRAWKLQELELLPGRRGTALRLYLRSCRTCAQDVFPGLVFCAAHRLPRVRKGPTVMAFLTQVDPPLPLSGYLVSKATHVVMGVSFSCSLTHMGALQVVGQGT